MMKKISMLFVAITLFIACPTIGIGSYILENYEHSGLGGIGALFIIVFIGLGFIAAFFATKKYEIDNKQ